MKSMRRDFEYKKRALQKKAALEIEKMKLFHEKELDRLRKQVPASLFIYANHSSPRNTPAVLRVQLLEYSRCISPSELDELQRLFKERLSESEVCAYLST